jgi:hypothetical protein
MDLAKKEASGRKDTEVPQMPLHVVSLGAGRQSSAMVLRAQHGEISPVPDLIIFADTKREPQKVYAWLAMLKSLLRLPVVEVSKGDLGEDSMRVFVSRKSGKRYLKGLIPAFTLNDDGSKGLMGRKCTQDYKIDMIVSYCRSAIGKAKFSFWRKKHRSALSEIREYEKRSKAARKAKKECRLPSPLPPYPTSAMQECKGDPLVVMWIGISIDEADRMKESKEPWIKTRWPLIELQMDKDDCVSWMLSHGYPSPPRSACTFCPFHSDDEWIKLRDESPDEFKEVIKYESELQDAARNQEALRGIPFLHESCIPIGQVVFKPTAPGYRQVSLFRNECICP